MALSLDQIRPLVATELSGMLKSQIDDCIQWAMFHFSQETGLYRADFTGIYLKSLDIGTVDVSAVQSDVIEIPTVAIDGKDLLQVEYFFNGEEIINIARSFEDNSPVAGQAVLRTKRKADEFDEDFFYENEQAITYGILSRGHSKAGGTWTNMELAFQNKNLFEREVSLGRKRAFNKFGSRKMSKVPLG